MKTRTAVPAVLALVACATLGLVSCGGGGGYGGSSGAGGTTTYTIGGTLNGSVGDVTLQLNGANDRVLSAPGAFTFATGLAYLAGYSVTVSSSAQNCRVTNGAGTVGLSNVTNVSVTCTSVVRSAALSGAAENPPVTSAASGRGAVVVNPTTLEITGGMTFSGLTPSAGGHHIHQSPSGSPGQNGPVIIALELSPDGRSATAPAGTVLTAGQYAALLAGELYFNVHTVANPNGEIRGRINVQGGVTAGLATLNGASEVPANASAATGRGTIVFDSTTREVLVAYATHSVANSNVAHVHTGALGVSGPADVLSLLQGTNVFTAGSPSTLTLQNVTDLNAGNTYFNVHSLPNFPNGEIRGQIAVQ